MGEFLSLLTCKLIKSKTQLTHQLKSSRNSPAFKQIFQSVHVERKRETHCLVQRIALGCGDNIACIERKGTHLETCTHGKVFSVALIGTFVVVSGTHAKLVVVHVFGSNT